METRKATSRVSGLVCLSMALVGSLAFAGGPTRLAPGGAPVRWIPARVGYVIDNGPLGVNSRDQAAGIVRAAFKVWEDVDTSTIAFDDLGFLNVDVDVTNYDPYLSAKRPEGNVIIFDHDGSITDDFLGEDSAEVIGFASAVPAGQSSNRYDFAFAVLNGPASDDPSFQGTMIHEFGHLIGLDHTQAAHDQAMNGITADNTNIPIMYPYRLPFSPVSLRPDDKAWISWLYPTSDFAQKTGTIKGQVFHPPGTPLPGAHVVAVQVTTTPDGGVTESKREIISVVSDFLVKGDGSFEIPGLAAENYVVFMEPLFDDFVEGSGVGPFDLRFEDFFKDYYNGTLESDQENPDEKVVVAVAAAQAVAPIDLIANRIANRLDLLEDDSDMLYRFPEGFTFPFFGKIYTEVFVNADGNLTFQKGDGIPGEPRDVDRFVNGPPRIAPLFTDLDPSNRGQVTATSGPGEFTFTWDGVPEFTDTGTSAVNRFSVTLFSNGNIRFKYEQLSVTPDPNDAFPGGLQAIVGITPGGGATGQTVDLSATTTIQVADKPIYEVFAGTTLDLAGREVNFVSSNVQLLFPFYAGNALTFSGYAFTNFSSQDAALQLEARGVDGSVLSFGDNPHSETVRAQTQVAKLGSEYFNISTGTEQSGWIRVVSSTPSVASFFQIGDGLTGPITKMDGSIAVTTQSKTLFFSRIYDGPAVFPTLSSGFLNAITRISLANPNGSPITVRFTFYTQNGQPLSLTPERTIPPQGFLLERVATLVGVQTPLSDGYLRVDVVQGDGAIGFELIELENSVMGLNASNGNAGDVAYSAQLASGTDTGIGVFTNLKLVNTSSQNRTITITPYSGDGTVLSSLGNVTLQPNQTFQRDAAEMFGGSLNATILGSLVIRADGPGVIGDVVFGDPQAANYAAALPLQTAGFTKAVFSQVANGGGNADPSKNTFTGIALFNPNGESATITLKVFDRTGTQIGSTRNLTLAPRNRISELVENLVTGTENLVQGYISVESTRPIVAQQLFGNDSLTFLSAVPPQVTQ